MQNSRSRSQMRKRAELNLVAEQGIRCMMMRGGTSKGAYFLASDLPSDVVERDRLLLSVMGSPDPRQVDGIGGAHPLTSKVAIVSKSKDKDCDIDFLFCQVGIDKPMVDTTPNCGNILSGVAPFAIERGLVSAANGTTRVKVRTINTGTIAELLVETPGGFVNYEGAARIDGVPGTAAPVVINFLDAEGSVCGSLLPTGNAKDRVADIEVTLIDNGMPCVVLRAGDVGKTGYEPRDQLDKDQVLKKRLEEIRIPAGRLMNLGDVKGKVVPKMILIASPKDGGHISTRSFIPHECHASIGVFAAVTVATACVLPGSVADGIAKIPSGHSKTMSVEHPTGEFSVNLTVGGTFERPVVERAGLLRTARKLFDGETFAQHVARTTATVQAAE